MDPTTTTRAATTIATQITTDNKMRNIKHPRGDSNTKTRMVGGVRGSKAPGTP